MSTSSSQPRLGSRTIDGELVSPYSYEPLPLPLDDTIRVLKLYPSEDHIECEIEEMHIEEGGYQALSYVWGNPEKPFEALVRDRNGVRGYIPLTKNLHDALKDLRDCKDIESKTFWIDQICIDQTEDNEEKSHHVAMMHKVYHHASQVITYIGPGGDERVERDGVQLLERLYDHFSPDYDTFYQTETLYDIWTKRSSLPVTPLPSDLQNLESAFRGWDWLVEVAYGAWTQRLWIVQEQLLNASTSMLRGPHLISWLAVATMNLLFYLEILPTKSRTQYVQKISDSGLEFNQSLNDISHSVYQMWRQRWEYRCQERHQQIGHTASSRTRHTQQPLLDLMLGHTALFCHDVRDRIFSVLALSNDAEKSGIVAGYSKPIPSTLVDSSTKIYQHAEGRVFQALRLACRWDNESDPCLPSWAINRPRLPDREAYSRHSQLNTPVLSLRFDSTKRVMILKGYKVGAVSFTTPLNYWSRSNLMGDWTDGTKMTLHRNWSEVLLHWGVSLENLVAFRMCSARDPAQSVFTSPPTGGRSSYQELVYQFWCALRYDYSLQRRRRPIPDAKDGRTFAIVRDMVSQIAMVLLDDEGMSTFDPDASLIPEELAATDKYNHNSIWRGRSFGLTTCGKVFSAMHRVQEGDIVAALQGCTDRFWTFRPAGNESYRVIGDIYIPQLTQMEIDVFDDSDVVYEDIHIV